jgi:peptidoglycan/LPS O-acetylase OafA/YrhL
VGVFFALSGFLLYRPYLAARLAGRPQPSTRSFLRRRWLRILPAYWVALTVLAIWPGLPGVFTGDWWRYYGLL